MLKKIMVPFMVFCSLLSYQFTVCMFPPTSPASPKKAFLSQETTPQEQELRDPLVFLGSEKHNEKPKAELKIAQENEEAQPASPMSTVISLAAICTTVALWLTTAK